MLDVVEAGSTGKQVQSDVKNVVRFIVGQMQLKDAGGVVEMLSEINAFDQLQDSGQAAAGDGLLLIRKLKFCGRRANHGRLPEAAGDRNSTSQIAFAFSQLAA